MRRFWFALLAVVVPMQLTVASDLTPPRLLPEFDLGAVGWSEPSIAFDGTRYLVVWDAGGTVVGAFVSASGELLGTSLQIAANAWNPAVASDGTNFLVAWEDSPSDRPDRLLGALFGPDGAPLSSTPTRIYGDPESGHFHPRIVFDGADYFVVWSNLSQWNDVHAASLGRDTAALKSPYPVTLGGSAGNEAPTDDVMPDVAFDGECFLVVWQRAHMRPGYDDDGTHGSFVTRSPLVVGEHSMLVPRIANAQYPSVAFDGTNYLVVSGGVATRVARDGAILDASGFDLPGVSRLGFDGANYIAIKALTSGIQGVLVAPDATSGPDFTISDAGAWGRPAVSAQNGRALVVYQVYDPAAGAWSLRGRMMVAQKTLLVSRSGTGQGSVSGLGISCGAECTRAYDVGETVTLLASPALDSVFTGWSGACAGTGPCTVTLADAAQVTAQFDVAAVTYALRVTRSGDGAGSVSSMPPGVDCRSACSVRVAANRTLTLSASPDALSVFKTWGFTCAGAAPCSIRMNSDKTLDARFALASYPLSVSLAGMGRGRVAATGVSGAGIECLTGTCTNPFLNGEAVDLVATPGDSSLFTGWTGNSCRGTTPACRLTVAAATATTANFQPSTLPLTVTLTGPGQGAVSGGPVSCNAGTCTIPASYGTTVVLSAAASPGFVFKGWSVGCAGTGSCSVPMTQAKTVEARFEPATYQLSVLPSGTGAGTVQGVPGLSCGPTEASVCSVAVANGATATLSATPLAGSAFAGWGVTCTGTGLCAIKMNSDKTVWATFRPGP